MEIQNCRDFDEILREAINMALSSLGERIENAIYEYLEKGNIQKPEIPCKIEAFAEGLSQVLGQDARSVKANVVRYLFENIGIPFEQEEFDKLPLIDYVRRARMQMYNKFVGCVSSGLAVLHFENINGAFPIKLIAANATAATIMGLEVDKDLGKTILEIYPDLETNILESLTNVIHSGRARKMGRTEYESKSKVAFSIVAFPLSSNCVALAFTRVDEVRKDQ